MVAGGERSPGAGMDLSVCTILRDELANLPGLAACLPLAEIDWVAVDTGSADGTPEWLAARGAQVHHFHWCDDFAAARNRSLELARRGWILWLDADDRPGPGFWEGLRPLLAGPPRAYRFLVSSPREDGSGDQFRQLRLFPNGLGARFEGRVHERIGPSLARLGLSTEDRDLEIPHLGYRDPAARRAKAARNLVLLERELRDGPGDAFTTMQYGNCLYQLGRFAEALEAYLGGLGARAPGPLDPAPPADPARAALPGLAAECCERLDRPEEAGAWYRLARSWRPGDPMAGFKLGKMALEGGDLPGALEHFTRALEDDTGPDGLAGDRHNLRRNLLAYRFLCETRLRGGAAPHARADLEALLAGGPGPFPLDPAAPAEWLAATGDHVGLLGYYRRYLAAHPEGTGLWEDFLERLALDRDWAAIRAEATAHPGLEARSGPLAAFLAKAQEPADPEAAYAAFLAGLRRFPADATLLHHFAALVNSRRWYRRCYADLASLGAAGARSEGLDDFLGQLEGLAGHA